MKRNKRISEFLQQTVFIGPALVGFILIILIPFVMGMYYSFTNWNGVSGVKTWAGFSNFYHIFTDENFRNSFWFTIRFTVVAVIVTNVLAFLLALLLTQMLKTKNVLRTIFFLPNVIGGLLLGFIWQFIFVKGFAAVGELTNIGFFNLPWLGDEITAFWALVIVSAWQGAGYMMVIYIASLINVPKELTEAANIDGASPWQRLRNITFPLVMPAVTICLFLTISNSFKMFDLNLSLTKGGPYNSTQSVALDIYLEAFTYNRMGLGAAKAFLFFIIVAFITSLQVYFTKKREVEA